MAVENHQFYFLFFVPFYVQAFSQKWTYCPNILSVILRSCFSFILVNFFVYITEKSMRWGWKSPHVVVLSD